MVYSLPAVLPELVCNAAVAWGSQPTSPLARPCAWVELADYRFSRRVQQSIIDVFIPSKTAPAATLAMSQLAAAASSVAAFRPLRQQPTRSSRRSLSARCAQQDPLLLRVARGEGAVWAGRQPGRHRVLGLLQIYACFSAYQHCHKGEWVEECRLLACLCAPHGLSPAPSPPPPHRRPSSPPPTFPRHPHPQPHPLPLSHVLSLCLAHAVPARLPHRSPIIPLAEAERTAVWLLRQAGRYITWPPSAQTHPAIIPPPHLHHHPMQRRSARRCG